MSPEPLVADSGGASNISSACNSGSLKPGGVSGTSTDGKFSARESGGTGHSSWTSYDKPLDIECALSENEATRAYDSTIAPSSKETESSNAPEKGYAVQRIGWNGLDDPSKPYNWSSTRKWKTCGVALLASFLVPMHGTSITVAAKVINIEFGISDASFPNSYWPIASWGLGCAVWIIVGLPLMEDLGIRKWFLINYVLCFIFIIPQAVAPNFQTLVITRFFSGGFGELPTSAVASIIPDLWDTPQGRTLPVSLLNLAVMGGLTIAPVIYAPVVGNLGDWRWIFYIQLIVYAAFFPVLYFCLEETRGAVLLEQKAERARKEDPTRLVYAENEVNAQSLLQILKASTSRPFHLLATEPVLLSVSLWSAFSFGNVFLFTQSTEQVFAKLYSWPFYQTNYVLVAVFIGEVLGWAANLYGIKLYMRSAKRNTEFPGQPIPESRLYISIFGSILGITGGMFVYGWTSYPFIHWAAPCVGLVLVGFGIQTVVCAACDYLEDAYADSDYAATAVGALAFLENIFGSFLPLAAQSMYANLGFHWASSLLGILALMISCGPIAFLWTGGWFRRRSPFMASGGQSAPGMTISGNQGRLDQQEMVAD